MRLINFWRLGILLIVGTLSLSAYSQGQAGAIVAVNEAAGFTAGAKAEAGGTVKNAEQTSGREKATPQTRSKPRTRAKAVSSSPVKTNVARRAPRPFNGPVLGDKYTFLNFEVISAEKPIYRRAAMASGAHGLVQVEVLVDTDGSVLSAKARTGNKLLWDEAERAALASKFNRPDANGQPARAIGFLVYRFGAADEDDEADD